MLKVIDNENGNSIRIKGQHSARSVDQPCSKIIMRSNTSKSYFSVVLLLGLGVHYTQLVLAKEAGMLKGRDQPGNAIFILPHTQAV